VPRTQQVARPGRGAGQDHLERDDAIELEVPGLVNHPHAAAAEYAVDLVAGHRRNRVRQLHVIDGQLDALVRPRGGLGAGIVGERWRRDMRGANWSTGDWRVRHARAPGWQVTRSIVPGGRGDMPA